MKTILLLSNHHLYTYNLRKEVIQGLINLDYRVVVALPYGDKVELLKDMGCEFIDIPLDRRGTSPIKDFKTFVAYLRVIKNVEPDLVLTYTLKPNLYGGLACRITKTKALHTVTGLGSVFVQNIRFKNAVIFLNKIAFKNSSSVFFMNEDNKEFYEKIGILSSQQNKRVVAGSGVNLDRFKFHKYPKDKNIKFTFIARILKDKGIEEFLLAAEMIKKKDPKIEFEVIGFVDEEKYKKLLYKYHHDGIINYLGERDNIPEIMAEASCIVLPSYGEGRGTVLQEGASIGRPLITCDTYGCKDNVEIGKNGYLCKVADPNSLAKAMLNFIKLSNQEREDMGKNSRIKAESEFDRDIVLKSYLDEIGKIIYEGERNGTV